MSRLRDRRTRHDKYYRRAKQENFAARSVYKLEEMDRRFGLFRPGQRVLDLGCRPGSWMQYVARKVGPRGFVVGLDRTPLELELPANAAAVVGDVMQVEPAALNSALPGPPGFHAVLSDMAPDTTGVPATDQARSHELVSRAVDLAAEVGLGKGLLVAKLLMGEDYEQLLKRLRQAYGKCKTVRPDATRKSSTEVYLVATGLRR